jgi:hypothetical protein
MDAKILRAPLTWLELNDLLLTIKKESDAEALLRAQQAAGASPRWLRRIRGRWSQLRKLRERREFERGLAAYRGPRRKKEVA